MNLAKETFLELLQSLIRNSSFSREEEKTAACLAYFLINQGITPRLLGHNVWVQNLHFDSKKPTLLLNSHHDTVKPNRGYTKDPFNPEIQDNKLYGLGSNDAGGALIALLAAFIHFYDKKDLPYNLIWAGTAEEEISGKNGIAALLPTLGEIELAIVGEPTQMQMATAEKGLMVLDVLVHGKAGHAAREEGINAIYQALEALQWFQKFQFPKTSKHLGPVKMNVTQIEAGTQHNVVPDLCRFVVDVRTTDSYCNEEVLAIIAEHVNAEVTARSTRLQPSSIDEKHPIVQAGLALGRQCYGSPTLSDQAILPITSLKMGPGDSARSHTADEFIYINEFYEGIALYIQLLEKFFSDVKA